MTMGFFEDPAGSILPSRAKARARLEEKDAELRAHMREGRRKERFCWAVMILYIVTVYGLWRLWA